MEENKPTDSIAKDISKSFVALEQYISDSIMISVNSALDKLHKEIEEIERAKEVSVLDYKNSLEQFSREVLQIREDATKRLEQSDARLVEFVRGMESLSKLLIAKG